MIPPSGKKSVPRNTHVAAASSAPRIVEISQIFGNCHSTGLRAYGALSYAIAIVPRSANRAINTMSSARIVSFRMIMDSVK